MQKKKGKQQRTIYFWTEQLEDMKKEIDRIRRKITRTRRKGDGQMEQLESWCEELKERKREMKKETRRQKRISWSKLLKELDTDPWGLGYKIVTGKLSIPHPCIDLSIERKTEIIEELFPDGELLDRRMYEEEGERGEITELEVEEAAIRFKERKAPGMDGIVAEVVKGFVMHRKEFCVEMMDGLFSRGVFPEIWKTAKVVLIPKPGRDGEESLAYRPICLINTLGKLYEAIIQSRLERELERTGCLSERQYGFRRGRSTVQAVQKVLEIAKRANREGKWAVLILVDVRNAFNRASWGRIVAKLEGRGIEGKLMQMIRSYFSDREIIIERGHVKRLSRGVPQGSILGPTLWNILYDDLLSMRWQQGIHPVAYADDLALVVTDKKERRVSEMARNALREVKRWMERNELELAPEKTEALVLAGMRRPKEIVIKLEGEEVQLRKEVKYLGVVIDRATTFSNHVARVCTKAEKSVAALSRILPNVGGPGEEKRRVMASVTNSIILYGAPVWANAVRIDRNKKKLLSVQRKMALRVCSGYRTMSTEAALVIAGLIPIHLLIEERQRGEREEGERKELLKREREETLRRWQVKFENSGKGSWTKKLIRDVKKRKDRKHGTCNYYLTQILSGHGSFWEYLRRFKIKEDGNCRRCNEPDTPEHLLTTCILWRTEIEIMNRQLGERVGVGNIIDIALRGSREWEITLGKLGKLMKVKEEEMR